MGKDDYEIGRGAITMLGQSSTSYGIGLTDPYLADSGTKQLSMISSKTSGTAIQLTGSSNSEQVFL